MNHPLKVYNNAFGYYYLMLWHTHETQHQLVVARSISALDVVFKHIATYDDASIVKVIEVEFVAPSNKMISLALKQEREHNIDLFMKNVSYMVRDIIKNNLKIPSYFEICNQWAPKDEYDSSPDVSDIDYHFDCKNCFDRVKLIEYTSESLYDTFHTKWEKYFPNFTKSINRHTSYSKARQICDDEKIWAATPSFGHHCPGIELQVDDCVLNEVLFYYQPIREVEMSTWQDILQKNSLERKAEKQKSKIACKLEAVKKQNEKNEKFLKVFE